MIKISEFYRQRKMITLGKILRREEEDPTVTTTLDRQTLAPIHYGKRRVGHPRKSWLKHTLEDLWAEVVNDQLSKYIKLELDLKDPEHIRRIIEAAEQKKERRVLKKYEEDEEVEEKTAGSKDIVAIDNS